MHDFMYELMHQSFHTVQYLKCFSVVISLSMVKAIWYLSAHDDKACRIWIYAGKIYSKKFLFFHLKY